MDWITDKGDWNTLPKPNKPVPLGVFWYTFANWSPEDVEYRQIDHAGKMAGTKIFWFDGYAFALVFAGGWQNINGDLIYDNPLCFKIGCEHDYMELTVAECRTRGMEHWGSHWHSLECRTCGHQQAHDSSD